MVQDHEIPKGARLYFGQTAKIKRDIEKIASEILYAEGFEEIATPLFSYHQHKFIEDEKVLIRLSDDKNRELSIRADSTIDVVRLITNRLGRSTEHKKWFYIQPVYRYPTQEFHQIGAEVLESNDVAAILKILIKFFDPPKVNILTEQERGTTFFGVPTMLIALLDSHEVSPVDFSSVKIAISGGSMVAPELVRRVKNTVDCGFSTVYGQTETSPVLTQTFPDDSEEDICNTVGQPLPNKDIAILDPKTSEIVPLNTIGEICSRGYCNMLRYNDNPEATKATIDEDGWLHTGDLGSMDERGYVKITGRLKEMIIRGGENLFPAEIENTLLEHPAIAEVAVVGIPDPKWGEIVGCFVRPVDGTEPKIAQLIAHCRQHLSPVKTPTKWMFVEEWPLTGSGKIQKFKLLENFEQGMYQEQTA